MISMIRAIPMLWFGGYVQYSGFRYPPNIYFSGGG